MQEQEMVRLNFLEQMSRFKWIVVLLLIGSVAYGAKYFDSVFADSITVNGATATTVPYFNGSKALT